MRGTAYPVGSQPGDGLKQHKLLGSLPHAGRGPSMAQLGQQVQLVLDHLQAAGPLQGTAAALLSARAATLHLRRNLRPFKPQVPRSRVALLVHAI